jgi:hypothetical protein
VKEGKDPKEYHYEPCKHDLMQVHITPFGKAHELIAAGLF